MSSFYILFDIGMAVIHFFMGLYFFRSKGGAARFLAGYNTRPLRERQQYDEEAMCRAYGKRMMAMAFPFLAGAVIDSFFPGLGCLLAWVLWLLLLGLLLRERRRREG